MMRTHYCGCGSEGGTHVLRALAREQGHRFFHSRRAHSYGCGSDEGGVRLRALTRQQGPPSYRIIVLFVGCRR